MRLFIAIELSDEVRAALAEVQASLGKWSQMVRWIDAAQLHMTLKFLGETPQSNVRAIHQALASAAAAVSPFELALADCGCFPPRGPTRIVWVGTTDETGRLTLLVEAVEAGVAPLGFPREDRPFAPHLTVGRIRDDRSGGQIRTAMQTAKVRCVSQRVDHVTLMQSQLSPQGASYSVVTRAELSGGS